MTQAGRPAPGWSVKEGNEDGIYPIDCSPPDNASGDAVSDDIYACGPTAAYAVACWRSSSPGKVLCLQRPWGHELLEMPYTGTLGTVHPNRDPEPLGLVLTNGDRFLVRDGGSWGQPKGHPELYGAYGCVRGNENNIVWATGGSSGIDRTHKVWTVLVGDESGVLTTDGVTKAYFVTTAG